MQEYATTCCMLRGMHQQNTVTFAQICSWQSSHIAIACMICWRPHLQSQYRAQSTQPYSGQYAWWSITTNMYACFARYRQQVLVVSKTLPWCWVSGRPWLHHQTQIKESHTTSYTTKTTPELIAAIHILQSATYIIFCVCMCTV